MINSDITCEWSSYYCSSNYCITASHSRVKYHFYKHTHESNQMENMLYFGVRCVWMCGSFGGALHVNSGVREGSPSRRSYEGCATIVLKNTKVFFKVRKILDIQQIFMLRITAIRHGELKPR